MYVYPTHQRHVSRQENSRLEKKVQDSCNFQLEMGWCQFFATGICGTQLNMDPPEAQYDILNSQSDDFRFSWTCFTLFLFFCNQIKLVSPSKRMIWPQEFQCGKMSIVETTHGLSNEHTIGSTFEQIYESHPNGTLHGANGLASAASRICRSRWHPRVMTRTPTTMTSPTRRMSPSPPWPQLGAIVATPRAAAAAKKMRRGPLAVMIFLGLWCELWWWWVFLCAGGIGDHSLGQNLSLIV